MRLSASLLPAPLRLAIPLAAGLWLLSVGLVALAVVLVVDAAAMRGEQPRLEQRLAQLNAQVRAATPEAGMPPAAELEALRRRVGALNGLSGVRGWSTVQLLAWFEPRLPDNVQLVSLHHKPREGEVLLVAESTSAAALTAFLLKLEKEPQFTEVLLSKQGTRGAPGSTGLQFEMRVKQKP
jgi:hypothetical protein